MENPEIDVLMAVKDGARHLPAAVDSILGQSFRAFRLIVVDDGSTDDTPRLLAAYAARDPRVHVVTNPRTLRLPASLNRGLSFCEAPLVARADADDEYHPERLARQVAAMRARLDIGVMSCGFERIDEAGRRLGVERAMTGPERLRFEMMFCNRLLHPGVVFRTGIVRDAGGYSELYWTAQDTELWTRLSREVRMDNLAEPLVRYRVAQGSIMRARGEEGRRLSLSVPQRQLSAYVGRALSLEEAAAASAFYCGRGYLGAGDVALARRVLSEVDRAAAAREPAAVRRGFRRALGGAILRQARYRLPRYPGAAARVLLGT